MRYRLVLILVMLFQIQGNAQTESKIILGNIDTIYSKILGETRQAWIYIPDNDPQHLYGKTKYPVVYLLDGDAHFYSVVGIIQQLSSVNGNSLLPGMIVVGIPNTDRMRDLTPSFMAADPFTGDSNSFRTTGGGERFISFMEKELMPYVDSVYPTLPYRTLIGHSLGGLMVVHTLLNHKHLFNSYISIDPSMWWDKRNLLSASRKLLDTDLNGKSLFVAIANTMSPGMDTSLVINDTSYISDHIRSILELNRVLQQNSKNGLAYKYQYYNDDTHGSIPLIATHDGLRSVFKFYDLRLEMEDFMNFSRNSINKVENHFKEVSRHFGFAFPVPEMMINQFGYLAMSQNKMAEAEYLFQMNIRNHPASFNVFDSMGDYYAATGKKDLAIDNYKKALKLRDFEVTRNKLNELEKK